MKNDTRPLVNMTHKERVRAIEGIRLWGFNILMTTLVVRTTRSVLECTVVDVSGTRYATVTADVYRRSEPDNRDIHIHFSNVIWRS